MGKSLFLGDIYDESTNAFINQGVFNMCKWKLAYMICAVHFTKFFFVLGLNLLLDSTKCEDLYQWSQTYFFRQWLHLGIDIHQPIFLKGSAIGDSQLWFSDYIHHSPPAGWAQITIHFSSRGCRISVADVQLFLRMVKSYADPSAHVVIEIMYGANSPLVLEEPIGIGETKESAEHRLFLAQDRPNP